MKYLFRWVLVHPRPNFPMYSASATSCTRDFPTSVVGSTSSQEKTVICPPNHSFGKYLKLLLVMDYGLFQSMKPQTAHPHATNSMEEHSRAANKWKQQKHCSMYPWLPFLRIAVKLQPKGTLYKRGGQQTQAKAENVPQMRRSHRDLELYLKPRDNRRWPSYMMNAVKVTRE